MVHNHHGFTSKSHGRCVLTLAIGAGLLAASCAQPQTGTGTNDAGNHDSSSGSGGALHGTGGRVGTGSGGTSGAAGSGGATQTGGGGRPGGGGSPGTGGRVGTAGATGNGGQTGNGGATGAGGAGMTTTGITCTPQTWDAGPTGWATQGGSTTGGGNATPTMATSLAQLNAAARGTGAAVIQVSGRIAGVVTVGSNKTILGLCGAEIDGGLDLTGSSNVIVRNLTIVGFNCTDSPSDCSGGRDAVHVEGGDHHLWFDHLDISDGSDGNLDITHGADFITISWTRFHYSSRRTDPIAGSTGHRFCNLIGHDDNNGAEDSGHLNVTFHHVWWADNVNQRMPRVRFGKVHLFNDLYTASGDNACIELGVSADIRYENNVFQGVGNAVDSSHSNGASVIQAVGNQGSSTSIGGAAFQPPYAYTLDATTAVAAEVMAGAGPK